MIPLAAPERILLDCESAVISAFRTAFPYAYVMGFYFHFTPKCYTKSKQNYHDYIFLLRPWAKLSCQIVP